MAQQITEEMIEARRKALLAGALKIHTMNDGDAIMEEGKKLQKQGAELEAMALVFEQQKKQEFEARYGPQPPRKKIKVELTDEQRQHVLDETGVRMEVVEFDEGDFFMHKYMPEEHPQRVEIQAIKQAKKKIAEDEGQKKAQETADTALQGIKDVPIPEVQEKLAELLKDPNWMGGMFYDKK